MMMIEFEIQLIKAGSTASPSTASASLSVGTSTRGISSTRGLSCTWFHARTFRELSTQRMITMHGSAMQRVADGGEPTPALVEEEVEFRRFPLNDAGNEGMIKGE